MNFKSRDIQIELIRELLISHSCKEKKKISCCPAVKTRHFEEEAPCFRSVLLWSSGPPCPAPTHLSPMISSLSGLVSSSSFESGVLQQDRYCFEVKPSLNTSFTLFLHCSDELL